MKHYEKLVRNKIPHRIRRNGDAPQCRQAKPEELLDHLGNKVVEEAKEVRLSVGQPTAALVDELADVYEVLDEIMRLKRITRDQVLQEQERKRAELGGFSEGWILNVL